MRVCSILVFAFLIVIFGCGGSTPPDYTEQPETPTSGGGVASPSSGSSPSTGGGTSETSSHTTPPSAGDYIPGRSVPPGLEGMNQADLQLEERLCTQYEKWNKEADALSKAWQDGKGVDVGRVRALLDEGTQMANQAQELGSRLRGSANTRVQAEGRKMEDMAAEILNLCNSLRDIIGAGK
jgi:hypothetical protein